MSSTSITAISRQTSDLYRMPNFYRFYHMLYILRFPNGTKKNILHKSVENLWRIFHKFSTNTTNVAFIALCYKCLQHTHLTPILLDMGFMGGWLTFKLHLISITKAAQTKSFTAQTSTIVAQMFDTNYVRLEESEKFL